MIDATRFRELWEAYCTHSANLKSAEEAGAELEIDYIEEEEARQLFASFLFFHAAELLALVEASTPQAPPVPQSETQVAEGRRMR